MENKREAEDREILTEIVTNERIIAHPTKGRIKFRTPTLEIQRKIDAVARNKKKMLRDATDRIPDTDAPNGYRVVPAYRSRDALIKEYEALGWWTQENEEKLLNASTKYTELLTRLEILEFESEARIYQDIAEARERLTKLFEEQMTDEIKETLSRVALVGGEANYKDLQLLKEKASSTEVDDILDQITISRAQYDCYFDLATVRVELLKLEAERSSLFSDSWQEQLQYYIRLAQVYYCSEYAETGKPLYTTIEELEQEVDLDFIRWIFAELQAFWQGISTEARDRLAKYSFTDRLNLNKSSQEESPVQPESNKDGDLVMKPQVPSLEVTVTKDQ